MVVAVTAVEVIEINSIQIVLSLGLSHKVSHAYLHVYIQYSI